MTAAGTPSTARPMDGPLLSGSVKEFSQNGLQALA